MFLTAIVSQEGGGFDFIWIVIPLVLCMLLMGQSRGGGGSTPAETRTESWYTSNDIGTTYKDIEAVSDTWRKESEARGDESKSITSRLRGAFGSGGVERRFVASETVPPRLYKMIDTSGPIYFELTEVEGGGTVVNATYGSEVKSRMAKFKASLPLKIPATPIGNRCPACGKPVLPEFNLCPYCGEKIIKG